MNNDEHRVHVPLRMKMCHVNIQSLGSGDLGITSRANYKLDQMRTILQMEHKFDIIGLSETWLSPNVENEHIALANYDVHRKDRNGRGGGVCVYISSTLPNKRRRDLEEPTLEMIWTEISVQPKPVLIGVAYRPPGMNRQAATDYIHRIQDTLTRVLTTNADSVYLMGDFNDRCTKWEDRHPESELKEDLLDTTTALGLQQLINEPTYITETSANILDLIFTNNAGQVTNAGTLPPIGTSKHTVIYCETTRIVPKMKQYKKEVWKYDQADKEGLNIAISDFPFEDILPEDVDEAVEIWTHLVLQIAKEYIPCITVTVRPADKPWMTGDIRNLMKTRNRLYKRHQRTRDPNHMAAYNRVKAEVNMKIVQGKETYKNRLIQQLETVQKDPKNFWKVAKRIYGNNTRNGVPTIVDINKQHSTPKDKANVLAEYFASLSQKPAVPDNYVLPDPPLIEDWDKMQNFMVTQEEVFTELRKLKVGKSVGPDGLSNELLKMAAGSLAPSLTSLYNTILNSSTYPKTWKRANITPIYKKGSRQEKTNYRPISLLDNTGKVFERLVFNKIYEHCTEKRLLTWKNSGYKKADSTVNQLLHIVNNLYKNLDRKEETVCVFLDQSRAFDRIHHESLIYKMKRMGIEGSLLSLLGNYLEDRKIRVALDGAKSGWYRIFAGVPQGSILGPLMFLIYVNDIVDNLQCDIHLYADDAVLLTNYKIETEVAAFERINRDLRKLEEWAIQWHMSFNPIKTKYMIVAKDTVRARPEIQMSNVILEQVHSYTQLGLTINDTLNWNDHINTIINRANKKIGILWRLSNDLPRYAVENIYTSYIRPQIEYSAIIYDNCTAEQSNRLETCQRRAAVACTRAYMRSNTELLMREVGWSTLKERRTYTSLLLMYKIVRRHTPDYLHELLPPRLGIVNRTRNINNFAIIRSNTEKHRRSAIPSMIRAWNTLDPQIQASTTTGSFKAALKRRFPQRISHLNQFKGTSAVNHTRMRLGLSALKQQLHAHRIIDSPICALCRKEDETTDHYLLRCTRHDGPRRVMFQRLGPMAVEMGINFYNNNNNNKTMKITKLLLIGSNELSHDNNMFVFSVVHDYITASKRF